MIGVCKLPWIDFKHPDRGEGAEGTKNLPIAEWYKDAFTALTGFEYSSLDDMLIPEEKKPCYIEHIGLPKGASLRIGNTNRKLTADEMNKFIRNAAPYQFDKKQAVGVSLDDLDNRKIEKFLEKSARKTGRKIPSDVTDFDAMKNVGIIGEFDGKMLPTVAGHLLFSKERPQDKQSFSRFEIRCIRYKGPTVASPIIDKSDISGTLDDVIDDMQKFILRNISLKARIIGTRRVEQYEFPEDALRELVANAVIHRDYMITQTYTQIRIFSNRIEISNPGNLPPGVNVDNLKDSQFSRNEIIAGMLKDMDYMEEYGRGVDIVFSRMKEVGLLDPIFKDTSNSFEVTLLGDNFSDLNNRQVSIWELIQEKGRTTAKECRGIFPEVSRATVNNDLARLVELGLIASKGAGADTYYEPLY